jgi:8-hydroxy-5-deazaflavin:NADPH oxidoreductase
VALARDLGFDSVDAGRLAMARYTQPFAMLWIKLALVHGLGRRFAFRPLRR